MVEEPAVELDRIFAALSDPTRRAIVTRLSTRGAAIGELARPFEMSFAAVSKHVRVLEAAGLVHREILGRVHVCTLRPEPLRRANDWLAAYSRFWATRLDTLEGLLDDDRPEA